MAKTATIELRLGSTNTPDPPVTSGAQPRELKAKPRRKTRGTGQSPRDKGTNPRSKGSAPSQTGYWTYAMVKARVQTIARIDKLNRLSPKKRMEVQNKLAAAYDRARAGRRGKDSALRDVDSSRENPSLPHPTMTLSAYGPNMCPEVLDHLERVELELKIAPNRRNRALFWGASNGCWAAKHGGPYADHLGAGGWNGILADVVSQSGFYNSGEELSVSPIELCGAVERYLTAKPRTDPYRTGMGFFDEGPRYARSKIESVEGYGVTLFPFEPCQSECCSEGRWATDEYGRSVLTRYETAVAGRRLPSPSEDRQGPSGACQPTIAVPCL